MKKSKRSATALALLLVSTFTCATVSAKESVTNESISLIQFSQLNDHILPLGNDSYRYRTKTITLKSSSFTFNISESEAKRYDRVYSVKNAIIGRIVDVALSIIGGGVASDLSNYLSKNDYPFNKPGTHKWVTEHKRVIKENILTGHSYIYKEYITGSWYVNGKNVKSIYINIKK